MPNVLVTGASGFIGQHLVAHLRGQGLTVVTDIGWQRNDVAQRLHQQHVTQVVHLAGMAHGQVAGAAKAQLKQVNAIDTAAFYRACQRAQVESFIWLSSIKVLAETATEPLAVDAPPNPVGIYAQSKAAGEMLLREAHKKPTTDHHVSSANTNITATRLVIIRPPLVYGPGVGANFYQLLKWAARGVPMPLGGATALRSMVGVGNLVSFIERCLTAPSGTYHVSDGDDWSVAALLRFCAQHMGKSLWLFQVPEPLLRGLAALLRRQESAQRLLQPLRVDMEATQNSLDWRPPFSVEQQLTETVQWFLKPV